MSIRDFGRDHEKIYKTLDSLQCLVQDLLDDLPVDYPGINDVYDAVQSLRRSRTRVRAVIDDKEL